jgi:hypothetical protein
MFQVAMIDRLELALQLATASNTDLTLRASMAFKLKRS